MRLSKKIYIIITTILYFSVISQSIIFITPENSNTTFFIATTGNDNNPGTKDKPFATLEAARNAVRSFKNQNNIKSGVITIYIRGGTYYLTKSFSLESVDSGSEQFPIIYKSYENEKVIITGSINLEKDKFTKVTDINMLNQVIDGTARSHIFQYDLHTNNIDYGDINSNITEAPELFSNDNPLPMARWPKDDYDLTGKIINNDSAQYTFQFNDFRPLLWTNSKDAWLLGYWYHNWADFTVRMNSIDAKNKYITFNQNIPYGIKDTQRYFAFNLFEEISNPGEWYLDRTNGIIYIYLPSIMNENEPYISQLREPFVSMKNTSYLTIEGLTFQGGNNTGIVINGGQNNIIAGCTIKNISKNAVTINDGAFNGVQSCNIYNTGTGGINITGGDRNTLIAAQNYADNNDIYNYSRIKRTYTAAINLNGVGNRASHNSIHDAPHTAILLEGNDHIIEYNEIYSVATETDDVGAIYTGRDWTFRGNIIRYNYIHNIENTLDKYGKMGIYLDDCMSSADIIGNVFYKVDRALMIGGGRDNKISNNIIINCTNSISFDERGLTWKLDSLYNNLKKVPFQSEIWKKRYPKLYDILQDSLPGKPVGNIVTKNALYMTSSPSIAPSVIKNGTVSENVLLEQDISFINKDTLDFEVLNNFPIHISGFCQIPFNKIGMYKDTYR